MEFDISAKPLESLEKECEKMSIKLYKPTTNARRNMSVTDYSELSKVAPERSLLVPISNKSGRNSYGRITVRHRGGGNRRKYRIMDFKRDKFDVAGEVITLEYDPNRSAHIALVKYEDGEKRYIIAPAGLKVGDKVITGKFSGTEVKYEGVDYLIVRQYDVLAIVE